MPDLIYNVKLNLDKGSLGKIVEPSAEREVKDLEQQVRQLEEALERAGNESGNFNKKFKGTTKQAGANNKAFSSTNQLLFSFSDGVQDAAQFSQGLAQGMRAIGNNIGFTAELFANLTTRVSQYNKNLSKIEVAQGKQKTVLGELKNSFFSAGGALLVLNAALTAGQFLFNRLEKDTKKSVTAIRDFVDEASSLRDIGGFDFLGIKQIERQIDLIDEFVKDFGDFEKALEVSGKASLKFQGTVTSTGRVISSLTDKQRKSKQEFAAANKTVNDLRKRFQGLSDDQLKELVKQFKDLNAQLVLNKTLFEMDELAQFIDAQSSATQETLLLVDAGLRSVAFLEQRRNDLEKLIQVEVKSGLVTEESQARYRELNKQLDAVNGTLKEYNAESEEQAEKQRKLAEETRKLIIDIDKQEAAIASLNASLTFGNATAKAIELSNNHAITLKALKFAYDDADESQKDFYQDLIDGQERLFELRGLEFVKQSLESIKPEGFVNLFDELRKSTKDIETGLDVAFEKGLIDEEQLENAKARLISFTKAQETILVSQTVGAVAKAAGAFGELFGASKKFRIAMAVADGAAAVVSTLASVPFPTNLAAAASIAAQVAQQINTIKNTKIGSGGGVSGGGGATSGGTSASGIISTGTATQMDRNIGFLPARGGEFSGAEITIVNTFDEEKVSEVADRGARKRQQQQVVVS
jgi:chromosome segregation ATPase